MKRAERGQQGKGSLELIEEAVHLLRSAPLSAAASYYIGALPFVLGLLYFWTDMSRSAFAQQHVAGAALGLAALFVWMKYWQAMFLRGLRAAMSGAPPPLNLGQAWRIFVTQAALQPTGLFLLPVALVVTLPFGWVYAFYQNLSALADGNSTELRALVKRAVRQASLWPRQNHSVLAVMSGFGFFVFLNCAMICFILPGLVKMFFGVESVFTRSGMSLLNTTFFAGMFGLAYLCVDPILKVTYALRCFYGESLESGEDLKAELRQLAAGAAKGVAAGILLMLGLIGTAQAQDPSGPRTLDPATALPLERGVRDQGMSAAPGR